MKHLRFLALAALVALPLSACSDDDKDTVAPVTGTISGTVAVEGTGLAGVNVALVGPTSGSVTTGAGGAYSFTGVEAGSYAVAIVGFDLDDVVFGTQTKTITITTAGQVVTVDFAGSYIRTANISGNVIADGDGLAGVAVTMTGPEGVKNAVTDQAGHYSASGLRKGNYTVAITVPEGYTFANDSYDVSVGVGEAKEVSFFGEPTETVDPVTASVVIKSVTNSLTGATINPNNVAGQIDITLQIDPGENDLQGVCVLLNGAEVDNGCQTLGSGAPEEMLQSGVLEIVFTIFTNAFAEDGTPIYGNASYVLSARLDLENAQESNVTTTMNLKFNNVDDLMVVLSPEFRAVVDGEYLLGGDMTVKVSPVLYSGKELASIEVCFPFDVDVDGDPESCAVLESPFPATGTYVYDDSNWFYSDEEVYVRDGQFSDGTFWDFPGGSWVNDHAVLEGTSAMDFNFDYEAPNLDELDLTLTEQDPAGEDEGSVTEMCCSTNWVGPDYAPADGLTGDVDDGEGIGVDMIQFLVYEDWDTDDEVLVATIAEDGTMADAGLSPSLTNDAWTLCVEAVDLYGNADEICKSTNGNNTGTDFGYDDTAPTNQTVVDQPAEQAVYNIAAAADGGPLSVSAGEDLSGFSSVPFRGYIQWWNADDMAYLVADVDSKGNFLSEVNFNQFIPACDGVDEIPAAGNLCYPDKPSLDGVYYITGSMMNQAGILSGEMVEGWVFNDQTAPEVGILDAPSRITKGDPATFVAEVEDALHLGFSDFTFELGAGGLLVPLGDAVVNQDGDLDPWDDNFPTSESAAFTLSTAILGVHVYPANALVKWSGFQVIHTDGAGNASAPEFLSISPDRIDPLTAYTVGAAGIQNFGVTVPDGPFDLCNGQSSAKCDDTGDDTEVDIKIVAEGPSGTFANPFLTGSIYIYIRVEDAVAGPSAGDEMYLVDVLSASSALTNDTGVGGSRTYTWNYTLTSDQVADFADGTNIYVHAMGLKTSTGTALLDAVGNANITVVDGK